MEFEILKKDKMTPKERSIALSKNLEVDRIQCCPMMGVTFSSYIGIDTYDYYHSSENMAALEIELFKRFGHDSVGIGMSLRGLAEAMGSKITFPQNGISYVEEPVLKNYEQLSDLKLIDPWSDGKLPLRLKALDIVNKKIGHLVDVGSDIPGPLSAASAIRGTDALLKDLIKRPKQAHELLEIVTENSLKLIDVFGEMGVGFCISDPVASTSLISPKQYQEFAMPYTKRCFDRMKKHTGSTGTLHICGKSKSIWELMLQTGMSNLSLDNCESLEEAKNLVGDKVSISGNIPPVKVIRDGSLKDIEDYAKKCIKEGYDNPKGFVLSSGCQIPMGTKEENVQAMMDAARKYGSLPINL